MQQHGYTGSVVDGRLDWYEEQKKRRLTTVKAWYR
jgi:hypothetical protein